MRSLTVVFVLAALVLSTGVAMAQYGYNGMYPREAYEGFRAGVGWVDPGDLDSDVLFQADYIWKNALLTGQYFQSDTSGDTWDVWEAAADYLVRGQNDPGLYYGGGFGWAWVQNSESDDSISYNVVLGKEFHPEDSFGDPTWFLEARYTFGTDLGDGGDIDGLRVVAGYHF